MRIFEGYQKGVNLGGWISQCVSYEKQHFETFVTEQDIEQIASWGLDHIRVPVDYDILETEDGSYKEDGFLYIDNCIQWCKTHGLNMILDLHKTYGYSFDPLDKGDKEKFFHDEGLQAHFIGLWEEFAKRYGGYHDMLAFELLNEIVSPAVAEPWNDIVNRTITAIRKLAPDTYIIFGGVNYNNVTSVPQLTKPYDDKIVYNFHCYEPLVFTHQKAYWVEGMTKDFSMSYPAPLEEYQEKSKQFVEDLMGAIYAKELKGMGTEYFEVLFAPAVEYAKEQDVPLYCGEYGVIDQAPLADTVRWFEDIHAVFEKYGIGRAVWNYKQKDFGLVDEHYAPIQKDLLKNL